MEHCLRLTGRKAQKDAEPSTGGGGRERWRHGREEKKTQVLLKKKPTKNGSNILIVKGLLLIDHNMASCAVDLQQEPDADV